MLEPDAPIANVDANAGVTPRKRHTNSLAVAVMAGVVQQFLNDAEDRVLQRQRKTFVNHVVLELDLRFTVGGVLVREVLNGLDNPQFVENRRTQAADQPPGFVDGAADQLRRRVESLPRLNGVVAKPLAKGLQPEQRAGELLREAVVDVVSDYLAFALVDIEQSPQQLLLFFDVLGGKPLLGNVCADDHVRLDAVVAGQRHDLAGPPQAKHVKCLECLGQAGGNRAIEPLAANRLIFRRDKLERALAEHLFAGGVRLVAVDKQDVCLGVDHHHKIRKVFEKAAQLAF